MTVRLPARRCVGFFAQLRMCFASVRVRLCVFVSLLVLVFLKDRTDSRLFCVPLKNKGTLCCSSSSDEQQQTGSNMRAGEKACQLLYKH